MILLALLTALGGHHVGRATVFGPAHVDRDNPRDVLACSVRVEGRRRSVDPKEMVVALPPWKARCGVWVEVCCPRTRRCARARVMDRGPRRAMQRIDPDAIDTTEAVKRAVGFNGSENVVWRLVPPPPATS